MIGLKKKMWWPGSHPDLSIAAIRVALALAGVMAACLALDRVHMAIPLMLGVIASALAETDDNWRGRLGAQLTTIVCFALIIWAVQLNLGHRAYLLLVIAGAAFLLTLLGALGARYRAITSATLIMALYTALAVQPHGDRALVHAFHAQEIALLLGAAWFGLISVAWAVASPMPPVEDNLARLYESLSKYLELKSHMFEPVRGIDLQERRLALALHNGSVVDALNAAKESLLLRMNRRHVPKWLTASLHRFFVAQDVHERTSSSHEHYEILVDTFFHSDVLYRCQHVLALLGKDCGRLAEAIRKGETPVRDGATVRAIDELVSAIAHAEAVPVTGSAENERRARQSLSALATNLVAMNDEIAGVFENPGAKMPVDVTLQDLQLRTLSQARDRLRAQLTLASPIMRHAIRLSLALAAGYGLMIATGDSHGFWILLTIVFVCQPHYGATLARLVERIGGTVLGLIIGWALLKLFPDAWQQSAFVVAAAVVFFMFRTTRYAIATAGITIFVLLAFNQVGDGYDLIVPRLLDTIAGSLIAGISVWLVLPCWNSLRLPHLAAEALRSQSRYFHEIMDQYESGRQDTLAYRIARRDAHNADAALSSALTAALKEPEYIRHNVESGTRLLVTSHILLNYISALGAHRDAQQARLADVASAGACLTSALEEIANALDRGQTLPGVQLPAERVELNALAEPAAKAATYIDALLRAQLALALRLLPTLRAAASRRAMAPGPQEDNPTSA